MTHLSSVAVERADGFLPLIFVDGKHALFGSVGPKHVSLKDGDFGWSWNIGRSSDNVEPVLSVVVHSLDVVEENVGPEDPFGDQVDGNAAGLVHGLRDEGLDQRAVHVGPQDPVVVGDEHEAVQRVQGDVGRRRQVGGYHYGVEVALEGENIYFLAKAVHHIEITGDPIYGHCNRRPGTRNTGNKQCTIELVINTWKLSENSCLVLYLSDVL